MRCRIIIPRRLATVMAYSKVCIHMSLTLALSAVTSNTFLRPMTLIWKAKSVDFLCLSFLELFSRT